MTCNFPPAVSEANILSYLEQRAGAEITEHLAKCSYCAGRAGRLTQRQMSLARQLSRLIACPSWMELGEYHLRVLPQPKAAAIRQHLAQCDYCQNEFALLKGYVDAPHPDLSALIVAPVDKPGLIDRIRVLIAWPVQPISGGGWATAGAGMRGEERTRLFQVDETQIALDVQDDLEQLGRRLVLGLITGQDFTGASVHFCQANQPDTKVSVEVDELGNFIAPALAPGVYDLILQGPEAEIHVQGFQV